MTRNGTDTPAIVADDRRIPETEAELVARARGGDAAAFEQLAGTHRRPRLPRSAPAPACGVPELGYQT